MHCIVVVHLYGLMAEHFFLDIFMRLLPISYLSVCMEHLGSLCTNVCDIFLFLYLRPFQGFWKKLYIQDCTNTSTKIIY